MITKKQKEVARKLVKAIREHLDIETIRENIQKENEYFKKRKIDML